MIKRNFTRNDLSKELYQSIGFSKNLSSKIVDNFFEILVSEIIKSGKVKISSFGTFSVLYKNERMGRNPKTGEQIRISASRKVKWKMSKILYKRLNKNFAENKISVNN